MALPTVLKVWDVNKGEITLDANQIAAILNAAAEAITFGAVTLGAVTSGAIAATGNVSATGAMSAASAAFVGLVTGTDGLQKTVSTGLVAGTTHTLVGATALPSTINIVATVANASDAVALPAANAAMVGKTVLVFNDGAHVAAVWPQAADNIDGAGAGVAVALTNAKRCAYVCTAVNVWESYQLGVISA